MPTPTINSERMAQLLEAFYPKPDSQLLARLTTYLDLLLRWNARTNLSAIREPESIVSRHFGESLFLARCLPAFSTLLDLGSGAGFPGVPIALAYPAAQITLAESQIKKSSFLREVVRSLGLSVEVFAGRAESMPAHSCFDIVTMRAVDNPAQAMRTARDRVRAGGCVAHLTTMGQPIMESRDVRVISLPGSTSRIVSIESR